MPTATVHTYMQLDIMFDATYMAPGKGSSSSLRSLDGICFKDFQLYPRSEDVAVCAAPHKGGAGRAVNPPHGSEVREDETAKNTPRHKPCRQTMRQNAHRGRIFGDLVVISTPRR